MWKYKYKIQLEGMLNKLFMIGLEYIPFLRAGQQELGQGFTSKLLCSNMLLPAFTKLRMWAIILGWIAWNGKVLLE